MSDSSFAIHADIDEVLLALSGVGRNFPSIKKRLLSVIGRETSKVVRRSYSKGGLHSVTGQLKSAYTYSAKTSKVTIFPKLKSSVLNGLSPQARASARNLVAAKAMLQNYGGEIHPKDRDGWLKFQMHGKWVTMKSVTIPPRNFISYGEDFLVQGGWEVKVNQEAQKIFDKYFGGK